MLSLLIQQFHFTLKVHTNKNKSLLISQSSEKHTSHPAVKKKKTDRKMIQN